MSGWFELTLGAAGLALRGTPPVQQGLLALMSAALIVSVGIFGIVKAMHPAAHADGGVGGDDSGLVRVRPLGWS